MDEIVDVFNSVLVVCVGNICRSPMGEYLLRNLLAVRNAPVVVQSAGLGALVGHGAEPLALEVMAEHGIDMSQHRARQLDNMLLKQHELVLVMEQWQQREIEQRHPFARGRVHMLGKWGTGEIADPYRKPREAFVEAYGLIERSCNEWCEKVW